MGTVNVFIGIAINQTNKGAYSICLHTDSGTFSFSPVLVSEAKITERRLICRAIYDLLKEIENIENEPPKKIVFHMTSESARLALLDSDANKKYEVLWNTIRKKAEEMQIEIGIQGPSSDLVKLSDIQNRRAKRKLKNQQQKTEDNP